MTKITGHRDNRLMSYETYSFPTVPNYRYEVEIVDDGDCIKKLHSAKDTRTGQIYQIIFSHYGYMSEQQFAEEVRMIELGNEYEMLNLGTEFDMYGDNAYE